MTEGRAPQAREIDDAGRLRHLLDLRDLRREHLLALFERARGFRVGEHGVASRDSLAGRTVATLFFEDSTRTRSAFELAARRLGATVLNLDVGRSSTKKGETLRDTLLTLEAMDVQLFVVRHGDSGAAACVAESLHSGAAVLNAGDGWHAHPTQALLDTYTLWERGFDFTQGAVTIVGDLLHSRVARSLLRALRILGCPRIHLVAPPTLLPPMPEDPAIHCGSDLDAVLPDSDVVVALRLQNERMRGPLLPGAGEYFSRYGLTPARLAQARPGAWVMHPGPINRGVEIASEVADGPRSLILDQVRSGVLVRMAVMETILESCP